MGVLIADDLKPVLRAGVLRLEGIGMPEDRGDALWNAVSRGISIARALAISH